MTSVPDPLPLEAPAAGTEVESLLGSLERQRRIFIWKCSGLDAPGMAASTANSSMTLGGLLKHVALVEDEWFGVRLLGRAPSEPWASVDWEAVPDWEWRSAAEDSPEELTALWGHSVTRSRAGVAEAFGDGGLDHLSAWRRPDGTGLSLRRLVIDMIEEYARHAGHADLLREAVDGLVGEDPPRT